METRWFDLSFTRLHDQKGNLLFREVVKFLTMFHEKPIVKTLKIFTWEIDSITDRQTVLFKSQGNHCVSLSFDFEKKRMKKTRSIFVQTDLSIDFSSDFFSSTISIFNPTFTSLNIQWRCLKISVNLPVYASVAIKWSVLMTSMKDHREKANPTFSRFSFRSNREQSQ